MDGFFFPELIASEAATRSRRFTSLWSIPAFNKWVGAESSRVIGGVAYAAAGRGDNWDARVLRLDGVGAGGEEGSGPGPDVVVADDGAVRINVVHWCYGVAAKLGVEKKAAGNFVCVVADVDGIVLAIAQVESCGTFF